MWQRQRRADRFNLVEKFLDIRVYNPTTHLWYEILKRRYSEQLLGNLYLDCLDFRTLYRGKHHKNAPFTHSSAHSSQLCRYNLQGYAVNPRYPVIQWGSTSAIRDHVTDFGFCEVSEMWLWVPCLAAGVGIKCWRTLVTLVLPGSQARAMTVEGGNVSYGR